jgi:DNA adenine methylase
MVALLGRVKPEVRVHACDHRYSFGTHGHRVGDNRNRVQEYLFVAR